MAKKARARETYERKKFERKYNNTNKMDKKGNRLMTNVSVAHANR